MSKRDEAVCALLIMGDLPGDARAALMYERMRGPVVSAPASAASTAPTLDLEAIEARRLAAVGGLDGEGGGPSGEAGPFVEEDGPALIAEVRRLRAKLPEGA